MFDKFSNCPYERPDLDAVQAWINGAEAQVRAASSYGQVKQTLLEWNRLNKSLSQACSILYIRHFGDASDAFYTQEFNQMLPRLSALDTSGLSRAFGESAFAPEVDKEFGPEYLNVVRRDALLKSKGLELMAREQELTGEYQQLKATLRVRFDGREMSEGETDKYAESPDRSVRKQVRKARLAAFLDKKDDFIRILDELVRVRLAIAKANGFDSYLDYMNLAMGREGYGEKELTAFTRQVKKELVPFCVKMRRAQARRLGLDKLMPYDYRVVFPDGNPVPIGGGEELLLAARDMYDKMGPETGAFFRNMLDKELIDVKASPNKIAGMGFSTTLPLDNLPFVFGNCTGTPWDVAVVTHEIGHAFQQQLSMEAHIPMEYANACNDVAEVPSKTMELFTYPYADMLVNDGDKYRFHHMQQALDEVVSYCTIHEYETWLYTHPEASLRERAQALERVTLEYDPETDLSEFREEADQGAMLFSNMAVYMFPRYVISYALSEMCAQSFAARMETDPQGAWEGYVRLCRAGGSLPYPKLLALAGLEPAYKEGSVQNATAPAQQAVREYIRREGLWEEA